MLSYIKTMAVKISRDTYPIAVACLPGGFPTIPFPNVDGCWLVINDLEIGRYPDDEWTKAPIGLGNGWYTDERFNELFEFINTKPGAPAKNAFREVARLGQSEEEESPVARPSYRTYRSRTRRRFESPAYGRNDY